jgi:Fe-S cluster assembly protein SufD
MSSALNKPKYKMIIDNYYNQIANKEEFNFFEYGFCYWGLYQHTKSKVADKPVEIMYFSTEEAALMVQPRNLVIVGENSHVQIIERHQSLNENPVLTNSVTDLCSKRAIVDYYKIQNDNLTANLIDNTYVSKKKKAALQ